MLDSPSPVTRIVLAFALLWMCACTAAPPPPRGGTSQQEATPTMRQAMTQPDAPEGMSRQSWSDRQVIHHADGRIEIVERSADTELGGAQDWARIVREYVSADLLKGLFIALGLLIAAVVAWSRGWPIGATVLALGAGASLAFAWWAGLLAVAAGVLIYTAYYAAVAQLRAVPS